jgi:hypothetical protein
MQLDAKPVHRIAGFGNQAHELVLRRESNDVHSFQHFV